MPQHHDLIEKIRTLPAQVKTLVQDFTPEQLTTPYNAGEWTLAQNIHHLADTHMVCIRRYKLILTSETFNFTPYDVNAIAALPDAKDADIAYSLSILEGLHARWAILLENLTDEQWLKSGQHATRGEITLEHLTELYAKHGEDHLKQMQDVIDAMGE